MDELLLIIKGFPVSLILKIILKIFLLLNMVEMCKYTNICILSSDLKMFVSFHVLDFLLLKFSGSVGPFMVFRGKRQLCLVVEPSATQSEKPMALLFKRAKFTLCEPRLCPEPGSGKSHMQVKDNCTQVRNCYIQGRQYLTHAISDVKQFTCQLHFILNIYLPLAQCFCVLES